MKKYDVFISYRHDAWESAHLIAAKLQAAQYSVFIDNQSLHSNVFDVQLFRAIENCKDFVLVLSPNSLDKCYDNNDDWVRKEIAKAMACKKNIVPIMLNGFEWPNKMPEGLELLSKYHAPKVQTKTSAFDYEIEDLQTRFLKSKPRTNWWHHVVYLLVLGLFVLFSNENLMTKLSQEVLTMNVDTYKYTDYTEDVKWSQLDSNVIRKYRKDIVSDWYTGRYNTDNQYSLGKFCLDNKKYNDALYWMTCYIKNRPDHIAAYNELGRCYFNLVASTGPKWWRYFNPISFLNRYYKKQAFEYFDRAKDVSFEAMNNLGLCYAKGYGCEKNLEAAARKYDNAAGHNFSKAQYNLATTYLFRVGEKKDKDICHGIKLLEKAANNDSIPSASAQMTLGNIYNKYCDETANFTKYGIEKDSGKAIEWYRKAMSNSDEDIKRKVQPLLNLLELEFKAGNK